MQRLVARAAVGPWGYSTTPRRTLARHRRRGGNRVVHPRPAAWCVTLGCLPSLSVVPFRPHLTCISSRSSCFMACSSRVIRVQPSSKAPQVRSARSVAPIAIRADSHGGTYQWRRCHWRCQQQTPVAASSGSSVAQQLRPTRPRHLVSKFVACHLEHNGCCRVRRERRRGGRRKGDGWQWVWWRRW